MPRIPRRALAAAFVALAAVLTACGGLANPQGWSSPHFKDDTLYYFPDSDRIVGVSFDSEGPVAFQWEFPDDNLDAESNVDIEAVYGDIVVTEEAIFFAGWEGHAYAIAPDTGRLLWTTRGRMSVAGSVVGGVLHQDGVVFFGTTDGFLYALDADTGVVASGWPQDGIEFPKGLWATPVLLDGVIFLATMTGEVHAVTASDGSPAWDEPFESGTGAIPELALIDDRILFVPTLGKTVYLLDPATGRPMLDSFETEDWVWTTPAYDDDLAFFGDFSGVVHALDITTGLDRWTFAADAKIKAGPAIVGDVLVVADRDPVVHFLNLSTGERLNSVPLPDSGTVRANVVERDGVAYVLTTRGRLFRANPEQLTVTPVTVPGASN